MTICYLGNFIAIHECIRPVYVLDYTEVTLHNTSFVNYWIRRRRKRVVIHPNFRIAVMESHASFSQVTCVKCCIVIIETESRFFLRESDRHYGPVNLKEEEAPPWKNIPFDPLYSLMDGGSGALADLHFPTNFLSWPDSSSFQYRIFLLFVFLPLTFSSLL